MPKTPIAAIAGLAGLAALNATAAWLPGSDWPPRRGARACRAHRGSRTQRLLLQTYKRDTGAIMHDLSVPVCVNGKH